MMFESALSFLLNISRHGMSHRMISHSDRNKRMLLLFLIEILAACCGVLYLVQDNAFFHGPQAFFRKQTPTWLTSWVVYQCTL